MLPRAPDVSDRLNDITSELSALPETIGRVLKSVEVDCRRLAKKNCNADRYYFAGTGPNVPNTRETALKIMETCYVPAQGFETEQFLHGPWVSLNKSSLLMVFAPKGRCYNRNVELVRAAKELWAPVIGLVEDNDLELSALCDEVVRLPSLDEYTSPFVNIVPAYLFAYYTCVERGFSPDLLRYTTPEYWQARQIIFPPGTH
jgi:glucosamine--fructose-6-phosphate aminotransferase (isomerizing)